MTRLQPRLSFRARSLAAVVAVLAVGLIGSPVRAQDSADRAKEFKRLMAEGVEQYKAGDHRRALEAFRRAEEIASPPTLVYNIGRTLQALGRCDEAESTLESYLQIEELSEQKQRRGQKRLREIRQNCRSTGTLDVRCKPSEAEATVRLEDRAKACPASIEIAAGRHDIEVEADGYRTASTTAEVAPGKTTRETVTLERVRRTTTRDDWQRITQWTGLVAGTGLLTAGLLTDLSARRRLEAMRTADREDDAARLRTLEQKARASRARAGIFYGTGLALAVGAGIWMAIDLTHGESRPAAVSVTVDPAAPGVRARIRW